MTEVHHISTHNQATIIIVWCSWTKKGICPPFFGIRIKVSIFNKICFKRTQTYMLGEQDMIHHLLMLSILQRCCIIWFPPRKKKKRKKKIDYGVLFRSLFFILPDSSRFKSDIIPESNALQTCCIFRIKLETDAYEDIDKSIIILKITVIMGSWHCLAHWIA